MRKTGSIVSLLFISLALNLYPQSAKALFQSGSKAFQEQLFLIAAGNFSRLAELFPDDPLADDAVYLEAVSYFYLKEFKKCHLTLIRFRHRFPNSPYNTCINYWQGSAHYYLGRYQEAVKYLSVQAESFTEERYFLDRALLLKGMALEKTSSLEEASSAYRRLIRQQPAEPLHSTALFRLGSVELVLRNYQQALTAFTRVVVSFPDSSVAGQALFLTAECYFYLKRYPEAEKRYRELLLSRPGREQRDVIYYRLIRILYNGGAPSEALDLVKKLEQESPDNRYKNELLRIKADLLFDLQDYSRASVEYSKAVRAAASLEEQQVIYYNLGLARLLAGRKEEALKPFQNAIAGSAEIAEKSLFRLGLTQVELQRIEEALITFERFRERYPAGSYNEEVLSLLGSLYERTGSFARSETLFTELLTRYPDTPRRDEYLFKRGSARLSQGDHSRALEDFFAVVKGFQDSAYREESSYNIGYIYSQRGEFLRALPFLTAVSERVDDRDLVARALLASGVCYFNAGDYPEALKCFEEITQKEAAGSWAGEGWFYLGRTLYKLERLQDSAESFSRAAAILKASDGGEEACYWQGLCEFRLGFFQRAREAFLALTANYPGSGQAAESFYRAGLCESQLKNYAGSVHYFDLALERLEAQPRDTLRAEVLFQKGWNLNLAGRRQEALAVFNTLAQDHEDSVLAPEAFYKLAEADFRNNEFKHAFRGFTKVISEYPQSEVSQLACYWAGAAASGSGDHDQALKYYWSYLEKDPQGSLAGLAGGEIQKILSEKADAGTIRAFYNNAEKNPKIPEALKNSVRFEYARFIFPDKMEEAFRILEKIRSAGMEEPLKSRVNLMIGKYYYRRDELYRALDIFTGITGSSTGQIGAEAQLNIARIFERQKYSEKAAEEYLKVYFLYPEIREAAGEALYRAGILFQTLGSLEKTEKLFSRLKKEYPDSIWLKKLKD